MSTISIADVAAGAARASERIRGVARRTPLIDSPRLGAETGARVWLKLENLQHTGSFKLRGALNRMLTLPPDVRASGCVTASSGNHGAGVAFAMQRVGVEGVIFVPEQTSASKLDTIRAYGADVRFFGTDGLDTEQHARQYGEQNGLFYLSPYNDAQVIAGQGSIGVEIVDQLPDVDAVFVSVGGGGLVSGIGSVLKRHNPDVRIIGCQPSASPVMTRSISAGRIVDMPSEPTLSDGTAGGIEADSITFPLVRELVDDFVLVDEDLIAQAIRDVIDLEHQLIEGAAAVAVAAFRERCRDFEGANVVILICGGNISRSTLSKVINEQT